MGSSDMVFVFVVKVFVVVCVVLMSIFVGVEGDEGVPSYGFYEKSCPQAENVVKESLEAFYLTDPTLPSALLRLMFHDCQVQGCDASILLDPETSTMQSEMSSNKNFGVRRREVIGTIKSTLEAMCPQQVSCADILILAARDAVSLAGGPRIDVPLGRRDSSVRPERTNADTSLPSSSIGVDDMLGLFSKKGMTVEETVAIMGAHTLGVTHCVNLLNRLEGKYSHNTVSWFEIMLKTNCPKEILTSNATFLPNDPTSLLFDNTYYVAAMEGQGMLLVDVEMSADPRTIPFMEKFAADQNEFFKVFSSAFVKLSLSGVLTRNQGMIRKGCNMLN